MNFAGHTSIQSIVIPILRKQKVKEVKDLFPHHTVSNRAQF